MKEHEIKISVIICTYNRPADLITCLQSIHTQTVQPDQLIIVDASDHNQQTGEPLLGHKQWPGTQLHYITSPKGLTRQRNIGIKQASGDIIYFFDDDVILEPHYLEQMNQAFAQRPTHLGGMGSVINMPDKDINIYRLLRIIFLLQRDYASGKFTPSGIPTHAYGQQQFQDVQVLGGCCMAFRRTALQKHQFDEKLARYAYMEDADIAWRVSQDGPLFYNPTARLKHMNSPVARDNIIKNKAMYMRNYRYLFFKNVYPQNKLRIIAHWWSIVGLFVQAILHKQTDVVKGYVRGLKNPF